MYIDVKSKINLKLFLKKNSGYKNMRIISKILSGEEVSKESLPEDLNADDITSFKYVAITSVEVERSFSIYKDVLPDNRRSFLFGNIKNTRFNRLLFKNIDINSI